MTYNAINFMEWFWSQIITIIGQIYNLLDNIAITQYISLFDVILWTIIIAIIGKIVINAPGEKAIVREATKGKKK